MKKLNVVWHRMSRKVVKNGFKRKPDSKAFIYSNKDLLCITGCQSIEIFVISLYDYNEEKLQIKIGNGPAAVLEISPR